MSLIYSLSSYAINFDELVWIAKDQELQSTLKQQRVLKSFEEPQMCRASFCYDYIICTADHNYDTNKTEFVVTKISGASIFFRKKLEFSVERSEQRPKLCEDSTSN